MGPRAGLNDVEKGKFLTLPRLDLRTLGRPARSQSLYRLRYPGDDLRSMWTYFVCAGAVRSGLATRRNILEGKMCAFNEIFGMRF
jgi:hypothetical protein